MNGVDSIVVLLPTAVGCTTQSLPPSLFQREELDLQLIIKATEVQPRHWLLTLKKGGRKGLSGVNLYHCS